MQLKKILSVLAVLAFSLPAVSFAAVTPSPVSPVTAGTSVSFTSSVSGAVCSAWDSTGAAAQFQGNLCNPITASMTPAGVYTITECDNVTVGNNCGGNINLTAERADVGYLSEISFTVSAGGGGGGSGLDMTPISDYVTTNLPIVLVPIIGIVLLFAFINYIISAIKKHTK